MDDQQTKRAERRREKRHRTRHPLDDWPGERTAGRHVPVSPVGDLTDCRPVPVVPHFLLWVTEHLMGPPANGPSGHSWRCPKCRSPKASLSVRPPDGRHPVKFKCHRCEWFGDQYDLLEHFRPDLTYPERVEQVNHWSDLYTAGYPPTPVAVRSPTGDTGTEPPDYTVRCPKCKAAGKCREHDSWVFGPKVRAAAAELEQFGSVVQIGLASVGPGVTVDWEWLFGKVLDIASRHGADPCVLLKHLHSVREARELIVSGNGNDKPKSGPALWVATRKAKAERKGRAGP